MGVEERKKKDPDEEEVVVGGRDYTLGDANDGTCACGPESLKSARPDQLLDG